MAKAVDSHARLIDAYRAGILAVFLPVRCFKTKCSRRISFQRNFRVSSERLVVAALCRRFRSIAAFRKPVSVC